MKLNQKTAAYLNIIIALIFAAAIVFLDVTETTRNWIVVIWFIFFSSLSIAGAKAEK